jgi:hypothetical protein
VFQQWIREGKLVEALRLLAKQLHERGKLHLDEAFVDATFASAKKGASRSVRLKNLSVNSVRLDSRKPRAWHRGVQTGRR